MHTSANKPHYAHHTHQQRTAVCAASCLCCSSAVSNAEESCLCSFASECLRALNAFDSFCSASISIECLTTHPMRRYLHYASCKVLASKDTLAVEAGVGHRVIERSEERSGGKEG